MPDMGDKAVLIVCPSCRRSMRVVGLRPGRFNPRCPRCGRVFQLTVPEGTGQSPVVAELEPSVFAEPVALSTTEDPTQEIPPLSLPPEAVPQGARDLRPRWLPGGTPRFLGHHVLLKRLGCGPRGQAFLALPASLRHLAVLKVLAAERVADPIFRAHFTREAFAASMIDHPNLAALRDLGTERGRQFASVRYVAGCSIAELIESGSRLEPYQAAVVILQAARGLRAAHRQGIWHRDVKPGNIRIDASGLVKVDDLGLEMTPSLAAALESRHKEKPDSAARVSAAVGTPAFMAPEQGRDPVASDGRADIYALGCTFYTLVTGKPPFAGENAAELIRQHQEDAPVPAREWVPGLPRAIDDVIRTMMGKRLDERYPSMDVLVEALERTIGLKGEAATTALASEGREINELADRLATSTAPARRLRSRILALSCTIWLGFVALLFRLGLVQPALGILGFGALTGVIICITSSIAGRSELLGLALAVLLGRGFRCWVGWGSIAAGILLAVCVWGGILPWFLLLCAGSLAGAFHYFLDRPWQQERRRLLESAREILRRLRGRGHDEQTLQELVAGQEGDCWVVLFRGLFGRASLPMARTRWRPESNRRWRTPLEGGGDLAYAALESRLQARLDSQHIRLLREVEERRLEALGVNLLTARRKARRIAKAMVVTAAQWRDEQRLPEAGEHSAPADGAPLRELLLRAADDPEPMLEPHEPQSSALRRRLDALGSLLLGGGLRLLLAILLFLAFAVWLDTRGILTFSQLRTQAVEVDHAVQDAMRASDLGRLREVKWILSVDWRRLEEPVDFPWLTDVIGDSVRGSNLAVAAGILLLSTFSGRRFVGLMALIGAAVAPFGARWGLALAVLEPRFDAHMQARIVGVAILIAAMLLRRRKPVG
jgi:hypothetical protein